MKIKPNIAYHCATDKLAKQFLKEAEEQNYDISDIKNLKWRDCCFSVGKYNSIFWGFTEEYKDEKYKMVEYTGKNATDIDANTKVETAWVIQRENGEFFKEYNGFYIQFTDILDCEKYDVKPIGALNFLERHKCEFPDELKNLRIVKIELKVVEE